MIQYQYLQDDEDSIQEIQMTIQACREELGMAIDYITRNTTQWFNDSHPVQNRAAQQNPEMVRLFNEVFMAELVCI